jgi:hypothetical protein
MANMLDSVPLLFSVKAQASGHAASAAQGPKLPELAPMTSPEADLGRARGILSQASSRAEGAARRSDFAPDKALPRAQRRERDQAKLQARHERAHKSLTSTGKQLLLEQFCREVERLLHEQLAIIPLMSSSPEWSHRVLNRHYYAIRAAAQILKLDNLASIAGRAEVLIGLLELGTVRFSPLHARVLAETVELLDEVIAGVRRDGSDHAGTTASRTAMCLYAVVEPVTLGYAPSSADPRLPTLS